MSKGMFCPVQYIVFFCEVNFSFFWFFFLFFLFFWFLSCFVGTEGPSICTVLFEVVCSHSLLCAIGLLPHRNCSISFVLLITSIRTYSPHADPWALNDTWGEEMSIDVMFNKIHGHLPLMLCFLLFRFLKEFTYAHWCCICLIKNNVNSNVK